MNITIAGQLVAIDINNAATIAVGVFVGMVVYTIFSNIVYAIRTTVLNNQRTIESGNGYTINSAEGEETHVFTTRGMYQGRPYEKTTHTPVNK